MKKRILGVALGAAILFTFSLSSMENAVAQTQTNNDEFSGQKFCPAGDKVVCFVQGPITAYTKKKEPVIEQ